MNTKYLQDHYDELVLRSDTFFSMVDTLEEKETKVVALGKAAAHAQDAELFFLFCHVNLNVKLTKVLTDWDKAQVTEMLNREPLKFDAHVQNA